MKKFLELRDLSAYNVAFDLSNYVWNMVVGWNYFKKDTVGKQFIRAIDSISANIAEGFGRYFKKDKVKFYRYSYGSVQESTDWLQKSKVRKLIDDEEYKHVLKELKKCLRK